MRHSDPRRFLRPALAALAAMACLWSGGTAPAAQTDLDAFMQQVLASRDSNWRKLQQYILDEREQIDMRGPSGTPLWGERRDYTWYVRDGFFIRSPLKVNGAPVSEADRLAYEKEFLEREQRREARAQAPGGSAPERGPAVAAPADGPRDVDGLIRQSRQPQFISSAYFLRFRFDAGRYALVGREQLDGRDVLRIEYYPEKLFTEERRNEVREELEGDRRRPPPRDKPDERSFDTELRRLMNKSSKVTLWIEPASHQIVKYTFDDLGWNFFPGQWLAQMDGVRASMTMGQPFPDVWLPKGLQMDIGLTMAFGNVQMRYSLQYDNYRQAEVQSRIGIPDGR
ncbi:MAG: hypothetical protein AB7H96_22465 [Vicinamibacterales bacterium]